jgi:uncharacterized integral membrane protein
VVDQDGAQLPDDAPADAPAEKPAEKPAEHSADRRDPLRGSRTSGVYAAVIGLAVVLILLIIFIAQNTRRTTVSFLWLDGQVPVAVALLIAAAAGLFLALLASALRILQLRRRVRRGGQRRH